MVKVTLRRDGAIYIGFSYVMDHDDNVDMVTVAQNIVDGLMGQGIDAELVCEERTV